MDPVESYGQDGDNQSFHPSLWEEIREKKTQIQFQDGGDHEVIRLLKLFTCTETIGSHPLVTSASSKTF